MCETWDWQTDGCCRSGDILWMGWLSGVETMHPLGSWWDNWAGCTAWTGMLRQSFRKKTGSTILCLSVPRGLRCCKSWQHLVLFPAFRSFLTFPFFDFCVLCMFVSFFYSLLQKTRLASPVPARVVWSPNTKLKTTCGHNWCTCILAWKCPLWLKHVIKVHPRIGNEGPGGRGVRGIVLSFFNLGARWGWVVNATPRPLYPGKDRCPLYKSLVGPRAGLDRCGKSRLQWDSIPGPSSP